MSWTEQKIQALKDMWGHGYSASEIAKHLGGLTRNAVIGKAHRLKLSSRPSPIKREDEDRIGISSAVENVSLMKSSRKRVMLRPLPVLPVPPAIVAKTPVKDVFRGLEGIKRTEGIAVTKAGERHCRWPVGDPRSPDFRFCGCTAHEGMPYCIDHARVAYQSIGKKYRGSENNGTVSETTSSEYRAPSGATRV
jgi:GcrA cell cycle regulator